MKTVNLVLSVPQGVCTATSLGVQGLAQHRSPGSGQYFDGRTIYIDLKLKDGNPAFEYHDEGGWRDAMADTKYAIAAVQNKRTKTALSNNAFSATPMDAYAGVWVAKTGGYALPLEPAGELVRFHLHECREDMTSQEVAEAAGLPKQAHRHPRCYLVFAPIELVILSNLTPEEYVWYSTHRPGKMFRQVIFTEIVPNPRGLVAEQLFETAIDELNNNPNKKTKTIYHGSAFDKVHFNAWVGYDHKAAGGIYVGDRNKMSLWKFPSKLPSAWERASG